MGAIEARGGITVPGTIRTDPQKGSTIPADGRTAGVDWADLERQDWHLWIMAVLLMFVLGVSVISLMFPTVFWFGGDLPFQAPQRAFFGFCVLLALVLVYMLQRQATVRRLKRSLYEALAKATEAEQTASLMAYGALPEVGQFRDSLAMEYRRASRTGDPLAILLLELPGGTRTEVGRAASEIHSILRKGESLFRISDVRFGLILPDMKSEDALALGDQVKDRLELRLPSRPPRMRVVGFPDEVKTLSELESRLRSTIQ